jgi:hypothetical protein
MPYLPASPPVTKDDAKADAQVETTVPMSKSAPSMLKGVVLGPQVKIAVKPLALSTAVHPFHENRVGTQYLMQSPCNMVCEGHDIPQFSGLGMSIGLQQAVPCLGITLSSIAISRALALQSIAKRRHLAEASILGDLLHSQQSQNSRPVPPQVQFLWDMLHANLNGPQN